MSPDASDQERAITWTADDSRSAAERMLLVAGELRVAYEGQSESPLDAVPK